MPFLRVPKTIWGEIAIVVSLSVVSGCSPLKPSFYDGWYYGISSETKCLPMSRIEAEVNNKIVNVYIGSYRIVGQIDIDGNITGVDSTEPNVAFNGHIAGPLLGKTLTGQVMDGRCNPKVEMVPPQTR